MLDPARANELLARIGHGGFYLLKLVQAAVASRARLIKVRLGDYWTEVAFHGPSTDQPYGPAMNSIPTGAVMDALSSPVFALDDTAASHLAQALNATLLLEPGSVEWIVWFDTLQQRLFVDQRTWTKEELLTRPWTESLPGYRFRLSVTRPPEPPPEKNLLGFLRRPPASAPSVWQHDTLSGRCQYAPAAVFLNGCRLDRPDLGGDRFRPDCPYHVAERYVVADKATTDRIAVPPCEARNQGPSLGYYDCVAERGKPFRGRALRDLQCTAMLALTAEAGPSTVTFVKHGITLDTQTVQLGPGTARIVTSCAGLRTDLSQSRVSQDEAYDARLDFLRVQLEDMARPRDS